MPVYSRELTWPLEPFTRGKLIPAEAGEILLKIYGNILVKESPSLDGIPI